MLPCGPRQAAEAASTDNYQAVPDPISTLRLDLIPLDPDALEQLVDENRDEAQRILGLEFPPEFPSEDDLDGFLPVQLRRMRESPDRREWMARLIISKDQEFVGHCGFHGPPDIIGRAEIGYTVFAPYRGRGYAKEAAEALVRFAFAQGEEEVFATVSPSNAPSLAVVRHLGFIEVGTQEDEVDGLELVFVIPAPPKT